MFIVSVTLAIFHVQFSFSENDSLEIRAHTIYINTICQCLPYKQENFDRAKNSSGRKTSVKKRETGFTLPRNQDHSINYD